MRKAEIVLRIAEATDLTQVKAEAAVDVVFDTIKSTLQEGESVILRRFGTFQVRDKAGRDGSSVPLGFKTGSTVAPLTATLNTLPDLNRTTRRARIGASSPVLGLRPRRPALSRT